MRVSLTCSSSSSTSSTSSTECPVTTQFAQGGLHLKSSTWFSGSVTTINEVLDGTHLTYVPLPGFAGVETITMTITDRGGDTSVSRDFVLNVMRDPSLSFEITKSAHPPPHTAAALSTDEDVRLTEFHRRTTLAFAAIPASTAGTTTVVTSRQRRGGRCPSLLSGCLCGECSALTHSSCDDF